MCERTSQSLLVWQDSNQWNSNEKEVLTGKMLEITCAKHTREFDILNKLTSMIPYMSASGFNSVATKICTQNEMVVS